MRKRPTHTFNAIYICLILFFILASFLCTGQIKGIVMDDKGEPVEGAAVTALQLCDSAYVGGALSELDGTFLIPLTTTTPSLLIISSEAIGYEKRRIVVSNSDSIKLIMPHKGIPLGEVIVNAPKLTVSPGKFTFYPGDITKDCNDAFDVLKYVPLVNVNQTTDNISLIGSTAKILINGKESIMSSNVIQMLRGSDAARIKKIEMIVQPGISRQGEGPILNLILAPRTGSMGTSDLTLIYRNAPNSRLQSWYGGEWDKWQFSAAMSLHHNKYKTKSENTYIAYETDTPSSSQLTPKMVKHSEFNSESTSSLITADLGASLDLGHSNSLGGVLLSAFNHDKTNNLQTVGLWPGNRVENTDNHSRTPLHLRSIIGRLNYDQTLDSIGSTLTASLFYEGSFSNYENTYSLESKMNGYKSTTNINSIQFKANWQRYFSKKADINIGLNSFHDNVNRKLSNSSDCSLAGELTLADHLTQTQTHVDIFAGGDYEFSSVLSIGAGIRGRWYLRNINQYVQRANYKFNDFYFLPLFSASFMFNPMNLLTFGYTSTIEQPQYYDTNPITYWTSPDYFHVGNPDLKASYTHTLYLNYILLQKIRFGGKGIFKDNIAQWATLPAGNGVTYYKPLETGRSNEMEFSAGYSDAFFSHRWGVSANATYTLRRLDNQSLPSFLAIHNETNSHCSIHLSSHVTVGNDRSWYFEISGQYQSPRHTTFCQYDGYADLDITLVKHFKFGGRLMFTASNLMNHKNSGHYECGAYSQQFRNITTNRSFLLKFDISFGKRFRMRKNPNNGELNSRN